MPSRIGSVVVRGYAAMIISPGRRPKVTASWRNSSRCSSLMTQVASGSGERTSAGRIYFRLWKGCINIGPVLAN